MTKNFVLINIKLFNLLSEITSLILSYSLFELKVKTIFPK